MKCYKVIARLSQMDLSNLKVLWNYFAQDKCFQLGYVIWEKDSLVYFVNQLITMFFLLSFCLAIVILNTHVCVTVCVWPQGFVKVSKAKHMNAFLIKNVVFYFILLQFLYHHYPVCLKYNYDISTWMTAKFIHSSSHYIAHAMVHQRYIRCTLSLDAVLNTLFVLFSLQVLQTSEREAIESKKKLAQEQMFLRRKLLLLKGSSELKRPRSSEGDSTTSEEIDVENDEETGYASGESDDMCSTTSIASEASEGDITVNTRISIQVS